MVFFSFLKGEIKMINQQFYDRCQDCPYLNATSTTSTVNADGKAIEVFSNIFCSNQTLCDHLLDYLQFYFGRP